MKKLHKLKSNVNNKVVLQRIQVAESYICSYKYIKIQSVDKTNHGNKVKVGESGAGWNKIWFFATYCYHILGTFKNHEYIVAYIGWGLFYM